MAKLFFVVDNVVNVINNVVNNVIQKYTISEAFCHVKYAEFI